MDLFSFSFLFFKLKNKIAALRNPRRLFYRDIQCWKRNCVKNAHINSAHNMFCSARESFLFIVSMACSSLWQTKTESWFNFCFILSLVWCLSFIDKHDHAIGFMHIDSVTYQAYRTTVFFVINCIFSNWNQIISTKAAILWIENVTIENCCRFKIIANHMISH